MREEEDIPTATEGQGTEQYDNEDLSDLFVGPSTERDFVWLHRDFYK